MNRPALASIFASLVTLGVLACVPPGNSTPSDAGSGATPASPAAVFRPSTDIMKLPFEDNFDRVKVATADAGSDAGASAATSASAPPAVSVALPAMDAGAEAGAVDSGAREAGARLASEAGVFAEGGAPDAAAPVREPSPVASAKPPEPANDLGPDWAQAGSNAWKIDNGRLCGEGAQNHGVWLKKTLPVNARIEFDASSDSPDGDLKIEAWGDGRSAATGLSYTNATSYVVIFGGWKNTIHAIARLNEHGDDRKTVPVDPLSDDPRQRPVTRGQTYHFKIERTDGKTVRWFIDGVEMLSFVDAQPLAGMGHDHFGFNDWSAKVCFDNVRVTPL